MVGLDVGGGGPFQAGMKAVPEKQGGAGLARLEVSGHPLHASISRQGKTVCVWGEVVRW